MPSHTLYTVRLHTWFASRFVSAALHGCPCAFVHVTWVPICRNAPRRERLETACLESRRVHRCTRGVLVTHKRQYDGQITRPDSRECYGRGCKEIYPGRWRAAYNVYTRVGQRQNEERVRGHTDKWTTRNNNVIGLSGHIVD